MKNFLKKYLLPIILVPIMMASVSYAYIYNPTGSGGGGGGVTSITATSPLTGGTITTSGSIGCPTASGSQSGCLSNTDWTTFNNKLSPVIGADFLIGETNGRVSNPSPSSSNDESWYGLNAGAGSASNTRTTFLGYIAGDGDTGADYSTFVGTGAGIFARDATLSEFMGDGAGTNATHANNSEFIGEETGADGTNDSLSIFLGDNAGSEAHNAENSIFIGDSAGASDSVDNTASGTSILIGNTTGTGGHQNSIVLGTGGTNTAANQFLIPSSYSQFTFPSYTSTRDDSGTFSPVSFLYSDASGNLLEAPLSAIPSNGLIGQTSGIISGGTPGANSATWLGDGAGGTGASTDHSIFIGINAGNGATGALEGTFLGDSAGLSASSANYSQFIGQDAGDGSANAAQSQFIGAQAGSGATNAANSIFIGAGAGDADTVNNTTSGYSSILIGANSGTNGFSNSIALGASAKNTAANQFVLGSGTIVGNYIGNVLEGDWGNLVNGTSTDLNDSTSTYTIRAATEFDETDVAGHRFLAIQPGPNQYSFGGFDIPGDAYFNINGSTQTMTLFSDNGLNVNDTAGNRFLAIDPAAKTSEMGDVDDHFNGTDFKVNDPNNTFDFFGAGAVKYTFPNVAPASIGQALVNQGGGTTAWQNVANGFTSSDLLAQTAAVSSVTTTTSPNDGNNHTYAIGGYLNITAVTLDVVQVSVVYTDENGTSQTEQLFPAGLTSANISTIGNFPLQSMNIRVDPNTAITIKTTLITGTGSISYDVGGTLQQVN